MTKLDSDITKPSVTDRGDGPADTTDPTERATSVTPDPGPDAMRVGTVNATVPLPEPPRFTNPPEWMSGNADGTPRFEEYEATRPNGNVVTMRLNLETGETVVVAERPFDGS